MRKIQDSSRIKIYLFILVLSLLFLMSSGRLVSSDEVSMFLTVESIVTEGSLAIPVENAPNSTSYNGKSYTWYEAGNIILGIPFYVAGKIISILTPTSKTYQPFIPRIAVSYTNIVIGALLAVLFFTMCERFGISIRISFLMSFILIFSTFLLPYFKMYLREPLLTLCLAGSFLYILPTSNQLRENNSLMISGLFLGYGILTKLSFAVNLIPFIIYLLISRRDTSISERSKKSLFFLTPVIVVGFLGTGLYNYLRFGNPFNLDYAGGTSFTTPLYVGLYGLLLSPGKGIFWFTPILVLLIPSIQHFKNRFTNETLLIFGLFTLNLLLSSMYVAWGGDGSWGPRYLAPYLPLLLLPITFSIEFGKSLVKKLAFFLTVIGFVVQIGGASIYAGAYLREIGEYPYQKGFEHPEFLYKAHFIPNFSPIIGHWRMLTRNLREHLNGNLPSLELNIPVQNNRLPINISDQSTLLHTLDYWFTYALYVNIPSYLIIIILLICITIIGASSFALKNVLKL